MSERNVRLFYNEMCKNEKLQNEIEEVLGGTKTESNKQALLNDIAKKYNFDFTPEEAKKFAENLSKNELSLDDISEVSGGIGRRTAAIAFTALTALGSLGSAGAIVSHANESTSTTTSSNDADLNIAKERIRNFFNTANDASASKSNEFVNKVADIIKSAAKNISSFAGSSTEKSKVKELSRELVTLFNKNKNKQKEASEFVLNLFKDYDNYEWYHKTGNDFCSYYLVSSKRDKSYLKSVNNINDDKYCLALDASRQVIYYKSHRGFNSYTSAYLNNTDLEKQLHQRRLFRNALLNICNEEKYKDEATLRIWANDLVEKIMPDAKASMKYEQFYR